MAGLQQPCEGIKELGLPPLAPVNGCLNAANAPFPTSSTPPTATLPQPLVVSSTSSSVSGAATVVDDATLHRQIASLSGGGSVMRGGGGVHVADEYNSMMIPAEGEEEREGVSDENLISREFYRRETLRATVLMLIIAAVCLFVVPIIGIMIIPVGLAVVYWLKNPYRFSTGGDPAACLNRNNSLNFYIILLCATLFINAINLFFLVWEMMYADDKELSATDEAARRKGASSRRGSASFADQSRKRGDYVTAPVTIDGSSAEAHSFALEIAVNLLCALISSYALYVAKKLQKVLDY